MSKTAVRSATDPISAWLEVPKQIDALTKRLSEEQLDLRGGPENWSVRETAHHLVEANLVAATIVIAALAAREPTFDWSWVNPTRTWMRRIAYDRAPLSPALACLRAVAQHVSGLLDLSPGGLRRKVWLRDAPNAKLYAKTVAQILEDEAGHAREHLAEAATIAHPKKRRPV